MRKKILVIPFLTSFVFLLAYCASKPKPNIEQTVKTFVLQQSDSLDNAVADLLKAVETGDTLTAKKTFLNARNSYKKVEWFSEYYASTASKEINGPPLPEIETEENKSFEPGGLQVIEEFLYPYQPKETANILREIKSMQSSLRRFKTIINDSELTQAHILDACKLEVFRVITTGISGFDTPLTNSGVKESAVAITAVKAILSFFENDKDLMKRADSAIDYLNKHPDFNAFNRMLFIRNYANPLTTAMVEWQQRAGIKPLKIDLGFRNSAKTMFDKNAINTDHFVNSAEAMPTPSKIALGKALFSDRLVANSTRTCNSCHKPEFAFTDGAIKSAALIKGRFVKRNAPTLYYAGLQNAQFYDMRSQTLENQAMDVIANKDEMHASVDDAAKRLQGDPNYYKLFKGSFATMEQELKPRFVMIALASYVRSLTPFNSRFDKYMRGDDKQMNGAEIEGFNLFMGKAKCGSCHFMPLFNGTAAPIFANTEAEVLGVPANPATKHPIVDADEGRYFYNKIDQLKYAFKTPTIRNSERTAPYMHNGSFTSLKQVIDFYNKGGGAGVGIKLKNQTLSPDPLNLSPKEQTAVIAFIKTLTDEPEGN